MKPLLSIHVNDDGTLRTESDPSVSDAELVRKLLAVPGASILWEAAGTQSLYNCYRLLVERKTELERPIDERLDRAAAAVAAAALMLMRYAKLPASERTSLRAGLQQLHRSMKRETN